MKKEVGNLSKFFLFSLETWINFLVEIVYRG